MVLIAVITLLLFLNHGIVTVITVTMNGIVAVIIHVGIFQACSRFWCGVAGSSCLFFSRCPTVFSKGSCLSGAPVNHSKATGPSRVRRQVGRGKHGTARHGTRGPSSRKMPSAKQAWMSVERELKIISCTEVWTFFVFCFLGLWRNRQTTSRDLEAKGI